MRTEKKKKQATYPHTKKSVPALGTDFGNCSLLPASRVPDTINNAKTLQLVHAHQFDKIHTFSTILTGNVFTIQVPSSRICN